jgi:hypothetical protein
VLLHGRDLAFRPLGEEPPPVQHDPQIVPVDPDHVRLEFARERGLARRGQTAGDQQPCHWPIFAGMRCGVLTLTLTDRQLPPDF